MKVLTPAVGLSHGECVPTTSAHPFANTLRWLSLHAGFPVCRLDAKAEKLLLLSVAAQIEEAGGMDGTRPDFKIQGRDGAAESAQRIHAERRKLAHYRCDNSAKV